MRRKVTNETLQAFMQELARAARSLGKIKKWRAFSGITLAMKPVEASLPGQELVEQGLADLAQDRITDCALLLLIAAPRLRRLGIEVPHRHFPSPCEHLLYARLDQRLGVGAHSHYNGLLRRIVSYARALERERSRSP